MKKTLFAAFLALTTFCLVGCEGSNETGLSKPKGLRVYQDGETLVLEWNVVKNADEYALSKNGSFWQMTSSTSATDYNPVVGTNTYEVIAFNDNDESEPATISYNYTTSGGGGGEGETTTYYIKHPWGGDEWTWKPMTKSGNSYTYAGVWGGVGANINTSASDSGAEWYEKSTISGASSVSEGETVTFTFIPSNGSVGTLSVSGNGGGGGGQQETTAFYIKHPWGGDEWTWKPMTKSGNSYTYTGVWGGVGANINTSASDSGAEWYEKSTISGASSVSEGETVTFTFVSSNGPVGSLSVSKNGGGGGTTSKPNAPTNVSASVASSCIEVTWSAVNGADSYNVYRATSASGTYSYKDNISYTYYTDCSVTAGTTYYYKITAENSAGESAKSSYASAKVPSSGGGGSKPSAPSNLKAEASGSCIALSWNGVSTASSYVVYRSTSASGTYSQLTETSHTYTSDCNVSSGVTYYYKVASKNSYGESSMSSYSYASIGSSGGGSTTKPSAPTGLKAVQNGDLIQLTWNSVSNATKYYIYRSTSSYSGYTLLNESYTNSYSDEYALLSGTTYYYKVSAVNLGGESSQSSSAYCMYERIVAPCIPLQLEVKPGYSQIVFKWQIQSSSSCGKPTSQKILFRDLSKAETVSNDVAIYTNSSFTLSNTKLQQYTNGGYLLLFYITLENAKGKVTMAYYYDTEKDAITDYQQME